jgi:hypothetical protein
MELVCALMAIQLTSARLRGRLHGDRGDSNSISLVIGIGIAVVMMTFVGIWAVKKMTDASKNVPTPIVPTTAAP